MSIPARRAKHWGGGLGGGRAPPGVWEESGYVIMVLEAQNDDAVLIITAQQ